VKSNGFSAREAVRFGWDRMSDRIEFYVGTYILYGLILLLPGAFFALTVVFAARAEYAPALIFGILTYLVGTLVYTGMFIGYIKTSLLLIDGKDFGIPDLRPSFSEMYRFLIAGAIYLFMVGIGLLLFIVPGIILAIKYYPFSWLIIEHDLGPIESLKRSSEITRGFGGDLFRFFFLCYIVLLAGMLFCLIGLIVAFPTVMVATTYVYRTLIGQEASQSHTMPEIGPQGMQAQ